MAQYYAPLMPVLKQLVSGAIHKAEERQLLGKAFECISLLASAVGKDAFRPDAEVIMQAMIQATQVPDLPRDDPVLEYMMAASERICSTLKEDFLPFIPHLLPGILTKLAVAPKEFTGGDGIDDADTCLAIVPSDDGGEAKIMVMSSSELEDLQHAIECVHTFVEKLGQKFAPFIGQTAQALLPVFEFSMNEDVRDLAFETWGKLCSCARDGDQPQLVAELCNEFMKRILPKLEQGSVDLEAMKTRVDGVIACLKDAGPGVLSSDQVRHMCQLSLKLVSDSVSRRDEAAAKKKQPVAGDEDDADEDNEDDENIFCQASVHIASAVMKHHPDLFIAEGLPSFLQLVQKFLQPGSSVDDRRIALFVVFSIAEYLNTKAVPHWPSFLPQVLQDIVSEAAEIRTPACYAVSFLAKEAAFAPYAADTAGKLAEVVVRSRARGKKKSEKPSQMAADNALSALVELLRVHEATVGNVQAQLWDTWIAGLPCQEDEAEGVRNTGILLQLIEQQKPQIVGANLPKLLALLVDAYKTDMSDDDTSVSIGKLLLKIGEAQLEQFSAQFAEKQKKKMVRIVREAQTGAV